MTFDPLVRPADGDIASRAVRLATAGTVLAMVFTQAPARALLHNFQDSELLEFWPLRDGDSQSGVQLLQNTRERQYDVHIDYNQIIHDTQVHPIPTKYFAAAEFAGPRRQLLGDQHVAVALAFIGDMCAKIAAKWRAEDDCTALFTLLQEFLNESGGGALVKFIKSIEAGAQTTTFAAIAMLMRGFVKELADFCENPQKTPERRP
ncbi:MAG: hypothetical protein Q4A71_06555 [Actinomycetaceae bacterium]|nr:hypothetical protein [Actinomycetaceae bacterium]